MKYITYLMMLFVFSIIASCTDDDHPVLTDTPTASELSYPDGSSYEYVFLEDHASNPFETFIYTAADYGQQVVVNYVLQVDTLGGDFASAPDVQTSVQALYQSVSTETFNLALAAVGITPQEPSTVQVRVKSFLDGLEPRELYSNAISLNVTTYDASFPPIYIVGSATAADWEPANSLPVSATSLTTFEEMIVLTADDSGDEPFTFRFLVAQEWGADYEFSDFDVVETVPDGLLIEHINGFGDSNFQPLESGTYLFTINLDNNGAKTLKAEKQ